MHKRQVVGCVQHHIVAGPVLRTDRAEGRFRPLPGIECFAFYDMARQAFAVIQTGERRFYGCFMLRKGVIPPEA